MWAILDQLSNFGRLAFFVHLINFGHLGKSARFANCVVGVISIEAKIYVVSAT